MPEAAAETGRCPENRVKAGDFPMRRAGILMPLFSLPSPYGIGTMGEEARKFVDFLSAGGQSCWQVLPLGPTGFGDSPYQAFSSFAGNPYLIDLDTLAGVGHLLVRFRNVSLFLLFPGKYP